MRSAFAKYKLVLNKINPLVILIISGIIFSYYLYIFFNTESVPPNYGVIYPPGTPPPANDMISTLKQYTFSLISGTLTIGTFIFAFFIKKKYKSNKEPGYVRTISIIIFIVAVLPITLQLSNDIYYHFKIKWEGSGSSSSGAGQYQ